MCSLIYQVAWQREFRLIFGASTAASAAVIAIFIGGLGIGSLVLGRRADESRAPLRLYGRLELWIALSAAATPLLFLLARGLYVAMGGSVTLGPVLATALRLFLASLILLLPTFLMGGTLPAAARSIEPDEDRGRTLVGLLYGINTLGAVTGSLISTFLLLETFGTRLTLWLAAVVNTGIALIAMSGVVRGREGTGAMDGAARTEEEAAATSSRRKGRSRAASPDRSASAQSVQAVQSASPLRPASAPPASFVLLAAGVVGFVFFLMELVWYRMLGPILGGTVFSFGLILAVALGGVGIGGVLYALRGRDRTPTLAGFAVTCLLEAFLIALPYAFGDRIAVWAGRARMEAGGFGEVVAGWGMVASFVILPAALVAGYQFPMLIGLLGQGAHRLGRQLGLAYAANTAGSILGALAGGFGLLPLLTAPGCWMAATGLLALLGAAAALLAFRAEPRRRALVPTPVLAGAVCASFLMPGPTAAWRHSAIGAGREKIPPGWGNKLDDWLNYRRRAILREAEGIESSVAMQGSNGLNLIVNGKSDSNIKGDAQTVVWLGLLGSILHPEPKSALVIGLGTGATAGWLADVPSIEQVDVVELEPSTADVARACAAANRNVLDNPKIRMLWGDAREVLLTSERQYDIIVSEPSNPYRAGIASLFTREFYQAALARLTEDGLFLQWTQSYEIDDQTLGTIYATLLTAFPEVETWMLVPTDLCFVSSRRPVAHDGPRLKARLESEPYRGALRAAWRATTVEAFAGHYVGGTLLARTVAGTTTRINTDDRTIIEFGFARNVGVAWLQHDVALRETARRLGTDRLPLAGLELDAERVGDEHFAVYTCFGTPPKPLSYLTPGQQRRMEAHAHFTEQRLRECLAAWSGQPLAPESVTELAMLAWSLADQGDAKAEDLIARLRSLQPTEAEAVRAHLLYRQGRHGEAAAALVKTYTDLRQDPWAWNRIIQSTFADADGLVSAKPELASALFDALREPFAIHSLNEARIGLLLWIGRHVDRKRVVSVFHELEPHIPWTEEVLKFRADCYRVLNDPLAARAQKDLLTFRGRR